ncbi:hypothetical protein ACFV9C_41710 [Kribbella sp. NPDC059898]|uniref:hypothetical protein n=1 Tax=Kribbella sp. NPDC059898 TaxID=3346995 RepID=UPI0036506A90
MGKKNRHKGQCRRGPVIPGMAEDVVLPTQASERELHRRVLEQVLRTNMFLLNYLSYVEDGGFNVPGRTEPRRTHESIEVFEMRRELLRQQVAVQARFGTWKELCAEELQRTAPSDAGAVALNLLSIGNRWCQDSGFDPTADDYRDGARPLLAAMCPDEHQDRGNDVLDMFWNEIVFHRDPAIEETVARYPIATIHATAAMTTWLYSEPQCVPDQPTRRLELCDQSAQIMSHGIY